MILALKDDLEILPDSPGVFDCQIQELSDPAPGLLARHLIQMPDGHVWVISTERTELGFTTSWGRLQEPPVDCVMTLTPQTALLEHVSRIADLVAP